MSDDGHVLIRFPRVKKVCRALSIVNVAYLGSGVISILMATSPLPGIAVVLYVGCFVLALAAVFVPLRWSPRVFRALALSGIGLAVPAFGAGRWQVAFPGVINLPVVLYADFTWGRLFAGANLVPGLLFVLLAICANNLIKGARTRHT